MSEEEKLAIKDLKILKSAIGLLNSIPGVEKDEKDIKAIDIILNLIEKQQNKLLEYEKQLDLDYVEKNYIRKDKIKEKIKELLEE